MNMKKIVLVALAACVPLLGFSKSKNKVFTYGDITLEPEESITFALSDMTDEINGYEVLSEYLPDGIEVTWTGKKFKAPKAGKVKYSKKDEDFVATQDENPCGFKLSVSKKGKVSGSFKVYVAKSAKKLKAYTAKISGYLGNTLSVTIKKVGTFEGEIN